MSEEDIKLNFITPALQARGWQDHITMETAIPFTDGKINISGNIPIRETPKKADYILYYNRHTPLAVVEAKDNKKSPAYGLQQAMTYAQMLDVPFAYSSNGDSFVEHDFLTGREREIPLEAFPTPEELVTRWQCGGNSGDGIRPAEQQVIDQDYYTSQTTYAPRYYQRNAVNRVLRAIARGQSRLLLVMATGTGKTYTAFQIVYRLLQSRMKRKILYLADRNNLVDQSIAQDFKPLANIIHKINFAKDDAATISAWEVYFSLYQQLSDRETDDGDDDISEAETARRLQELFKPDFFDLVIVDECHRGSAKKDSSWRKILEYFSAATQIGMTATPKETAYVSNIDYFGEPVYTYSLRAGIDDGFLAPFKVYNVHTNIGEGWRPSKGQRDIYGQEIPDRVYSNRDYDYNIVIKDRTSEVARKITEYLQTSPAGRMQKTSVFCANEDHAERMRRELVNLNADMVKENPDYVVRITGSDNYGKSKLPYFIAVSADYPVIATTSKLLSTGADCKMTKLIVIDQNINSMTEFKQILGRGTRVRFNEGKTSFALMDFRNVSHLFADPDWDGPVEQHPDFPYGNPPPGGTPFNESDPPPYGFDNPPPDPEHKPVVDVHGCPVKIIDEIVSYYDSDGKILRQVNIIDYTKTNIVGEYASLEGFIHRWSAAKKTASIREALRTHGIDLAALKAEKGFSEVDDFDFICHIAFGQKPLTRRERAENVKKRDFFGKYSGVARAVLEALLDKYMNEGLYEIENASILKLNPFKEYGSPAKIAGFFGGKAHYDEALHALKNALYAPR